MSKTSKESQLKIDIGGSNMARSQTHDDKQDETISDTGLLRRVEVLKAAKMVET